MEFFDQFPFNDVFQHILHISENGTTFVYKFLAAIHKYIHDGSIMAYCQSSDICQHLNLTSQARHNNLYFHGEI